MHVVSDVSLVSLLFSILEKVSAQKRRHTQEATICRKKENVSLSRFDVFFLKGRSWVLNCVRSLSSSSYRKRTTRRGVETRVSTTTTWKHTFYREERDDDDTMLELDGERCDGM